MDDCDDQRNTSLLSHSYMQGIKRITGNRRTYEEEFKISEEVFESRKKTWSWLFEKFSEISDDVELNIHTLKPDSESSSSHASEIRIPVRKSATQLQYWIETGNPPCRAMEAAPSESDETVSISESEATDFDEGQYSPCTSMFVNQKLTKSSEHLNATGSSASSVDTATYIRKNGNSGMKNDRDNRNADNNKIGRSINAATPKALLSRSMESPKNTDVWDRIPPVLHKSLSADVEEKGNSRSGNRDSENIVLDENIRRKIDEGLEKRSKNEENKDSEVTFESKESGIGSLAVECIDKGDGNEAKRSSDSSDNVLPAPNQSILSRRRKLYTNNNSVCDIITPSVQTVSKITTARKSFHPALDSPRSTRKKTASRPRLLTMWGRKSMNHSINKRNRTRSLIPKPKVLKSSHIPQGAKLRGADSVETSISLEGKVSNNSVTIGADRAERSKEVDSLAEESLPKIAAVTSNSKSSSSLSSNDVSQIINEDIEKNSRTPAAAVCKKNQLDHSPARNVLRSEKKDCGDDQGSIFQTSAGSSESKGSRMRSMKLIIKNLCATDLRSLGDTDSPSTPSPNTSSKKNEDSLSNTSMVLSPRSQGQTKSLVLSPKVILHDFLDLRDCCGELEKINNENWLRKKNKREDLKTNEKGVEKEVNSDRKKGENVESKKTTRKNVSERKKLKLKNKITASERNAEISLKNVAIDPDGSHSSEEKTSCSKTQKVDEDRSLPNYSREIESAAKLPSEENAMIPFTNTNHNRWESILVLESSDEEDYLKKLSNTFKSRSFRNKSSKNDEVIDPSTSVAKSKTIDDSRASKSTKTHQDCYKIVYSSSGEEETTVETRPRIVTRKYSKRNKLKNSTESAGLTTCSRKDECGHRSEGFQIENEKLEKQSPRVNSIRSERNKDKQSGEGRRDYLVARSGVNRKTRTVRKSGEDNVCGDTDRSDTVVFGKRKGGDRVAEPEINDKENENRISPVDRGQKKSVKSPRSQKIETFRHIARAADFTDSEEEPEVSRVPNHKERNKSSPKVKDKSINDLRETGIARNALLFVSDDESSDNDVINLFSKNNAGDNSRDKNKDEDNESCGIGSKKGSASPNKRRIEDRRDAPSSSKRRTMNRRSTNSTIVFRTKEYWELDSDNS